MRYRAASSWVGLANESGHSERCLHISKHIQGAVSKAELDKLFCYTRRVGRFILTDSSQKRTISPATYVRLAQLHNPDVPFFPSLKHLQIVDAKSSLFQLSFFLIHRASKHRLHPGIGVLVVPDYSRRGVPIAVVYQARLARPGICMGNLP